MVYLRTDSSAASLESAIRAAAGAWNASSCNTNGDDFPLFVATSRQPTVTVRFDQSRLGPNLSNGYTSCGVFSGPSDRSTGTITLFGGMRHPDGSIHSCQNDSAHPGIVADRVAHELGHYLGLDEAGPSCGTGFIMTGDFLEAAGNTFTFKDKSLNSAECRAADDKNETPQEPYVENDPTPPGTDTPSNPNLPGQVSPILIDLDRNGLHLSGLEDDIRFDLDADGSTEATGWTQEEHLDAFLVADRDFNGTIDDGSELFGEFTPLLISPGLATHGFEALAELDLEVFGGNGDGWIDAMDWNFSLLKVWVDLDHDAISDDGELLSLAEVGLLAIHLDYRQSSHSDPHGNTLRYRSKALIEANNGKILPTWAIDVYLVVEP
jgi:hypothetical protein